MTTPNLEVIEGLQYQSAKEQLIWSITTTNWGSAPSATDTTVYLEGNPDTNVSTTVLGTTTTSAAGNVITCPTLKNLVAGNTYRVEVIFTSGSNIFNCYFRVGCLV